LATKVIKLFVLKKEKGPMDELKPIKTMIDFEDGSKISVVVEGKQAQDVFRRTLSILEGKGLTDEELALLASLLLEYQVNRGPVEVAKVKTILTKLLQLGQPLPAEASTKEPIYQDLENFSRRLRALLSAMSPTDREAMLARVKPHLSEEDYAALQNHLLTDSAEPAPPESQD
jgi:hypothetical protein